MDWSTLECGIEGLGGCDRDKEKDVKIQFSEHHLIFTIMLCSL